MTTPGYIVLGCRPRASCTLGKLTEPQSSSWPANHKAQMSEICCDLWCAGTPFPGQGVFSLSLIQEVSPQGHVTLFPPLACVIRWLYPHPFRPSCILGVRKNRGSIRAVCSATPLWRLRCCGGSHEARVCLAAPWLLLPAARWLIPPEGHSPASCAIPDRPHTTCRLLSCPSSCTLSLCSSSISRLWRSVLCRTSER